MNVNHMAQKFNNIRYIRLKVCDVFLFIPCISLYNEKSVFLLFIHSLFVDVAHVGIENKAKLLQQQQPHHKLFDINKENNVTI